MAFLSALGDWLENSGWTTAVMNAGVARFGVAEPLVWGRSDNARRKYTHQVTPCALVRLIYLAYQQP